MENPLHFSVFSWAASMYTRSKCDKGPPIPGFILQKTILEQVVQISLHLSFTYHLTGTAVCLPDQWFTHTSDASANRHKM